ncbi:MAG TPA: anti-sigma factor [Dongiaceae bacterium]|nr:anti-sigma factor [Dongiaceae bacterium]
MDCERIAILLNAYIDGELDLSSTLTLESHLAGCRACRQKYERLLALTADLRSGLERHAAPADLRERMTLMLAARPLARQEALPQVAAAPVDLAARRDESKQAQTGRQWNRRQLFALAASVAGVAVISGATSYWLAPHREGEDQKLAEEVVASHIRSLMAGHLTDIASSDQHTIKPWFDGKVDVAPTVADYAPQGFSLVGGRLDYLDRRPVAALVYRHRAHLINVFACPVMTAEEHDTRPEAITIRGYNLLYWTAGDITYWVVSDTGSADLLTLHNLVQETSRT